MSLPPRCNVSIHQHTSPGGDGDDTISEGPDTTIKGDIEKGIGATEIVMGGRGEPSIKEVKEDSVIRVVGRR